MRLYNYLNEDNGIILLYQLCPINEGVQDTVYSFVKKIGHKYGFKVRKSESLISFISRASKNMENLIRYLSLYLYTDVKNVETRKELHDEIMKLLKGINKKELINFLLQLDKISFGLTSHIRHILQSVFGVELTAYGKWVDQKQYIKKEINQIRATLKQMGGADKELKELEKFENMVTSLGV